MPFAGIDIGTQSLKAVVCADDLEVLGSGHQSYGYDAPRPGWAEQDPRLWERALEPALVEALECSGVAAGAIDALGIAGQLDGCVALDDRGEPVGPCLIWMDRRAADEMPELDAGELLELTGQVADASHMAAKARYRWNAGVPLVVRGPCGGGVSGGPYHSQNVAYIGSLVEGHPRFAPDRTEHALRRSGRG